MAGTYWTSPSFDTLGSVIPGVLPAIYVIDGQVNLGNMTERDLAYMQKMNEFYSAGIIDPNWANYGNSFDFIDKTSSGQTVIMDMAESEPPTANPTGIDPECDWVPLKKPLLYEGQVLHLGDAAARVSYGNTSISTKCENIPLAVSCVTLAIRPPVPSMSHMGRKESFGNTTPPEISRPPNLRLSTKWDLHVLT